MNERDGEGAELPVLIPRGSAAAAQAAQQPDLTPRGSVANRRGSVAASSGAASSGAAATGSSSSAQSRLASSGLAPSGAATTATTNVRAATGAASTYGDSLIPPNIDPTFNQEGLRQVWTELFVNTDNQLINGHGERCDASGRLTKARGVRGAGSTARGHAFLQAKGEGKGKGQGKGVRSCSDPSRRRQQPNSWDIRTHGKGKGGRGQHCPTCRWSWAAGAVDTPWGGICDFCPGRVQLRDGQLQAASPW